MMQFIPLVIVPSEQNEKWLMELMTLAGPIAVKMAAPFLMREFLDIIMDGLSPLPREEQPRSS
ncbi:hypothetical protein ACX93W_00425 [Paenibacillus sp. CAU 1782]